VRPFQSIYIEWRLQVSVSVSNKGWLQTLIHSYMTSLTQNAHVEIVYSVGSHCTNLSGQQWLPDYSFDQSEADTIFFSVYTVLCDSGYIGPVVIDAADTDGMWQQQLFPHSCQVCLVLREHRRHSFAMAR